MDARTRQQIHVPPSCPTDKIRRGLRVPRVCHVTAKKTKCVVNRPLESSRESCALRWKVREDSKWKGQDCREDSRGSKRFETRSRDGSVSMIGDVHNRTAHVFITETSRGQRDTAGRGIFRTTALRCAHRAHARVFVFPKSLAFLQGKITGVHSYYERPNPPRSPESPSSPRASLQTPTSPTCRRTTSRPSASSPRERSREPIEPPTMPSAIHSNILHQRDHQPTSAAARPKAIRSSMPSAAKIDEVENQSKTSRAVGCRSWIKDWAPSTSGNTSCGRTPPDSSSGSGSSSNASVKKISLIGIATNWS